MLVSLIPKKEQHWSRSLRKIVQTVNLSHLNVDQLDEPIHALRSEDFMKLIYYSLIFYCSTSFAVANAATPGATAACNGYQVLNDGSLQAKIGLKPLDLIKSLDGVAATSPQQTMVMYGKLDTVGKHEIVIERNGKLEKIKYEIAPAFKVIQ